MANLRSILIFGVFSFCCIACNLDETITSPPNPDCQASSSDALCRKYNQTCSNFVIVDECGVKRNLVCDACASGSYCEPSSQSCQLCTDVDYCKDANAQCGSIASTTGSIMERCGVATKDCGTCDDGSICSDDNTCSSCQGESDEVLCGVENKQCGRYVLTDQCGADRDVQCGTCAQGECQENGTCTVCQAESNVQFCARQNAKCGSITGLDNCGDTRTVLNCGACSTDEVCSATNTCNCEEITCAPGTCEVITNACGQSKDCGACGQGDTCTDNVCGCVPPSDSEMCQALSYRCGVSMETDSCGQTRALDCGNCTNGDVCNPTTKLCECVPASDAELCTQTSTSCGITSIVDNCGQMRAIDCGGCGNNESCENNTCECVPETGAELDALLCTNKECGMANGTDRCGQSVVTSCGTCSGSALCKTNTCCAPMTAAAFCQANGYVCGEYAFDDGCRAAMQVAMCGTCNNFNVCMETSCEDVRLSNPTGTGIMGSSVAIHQGNILTGAPSYNTSGLGKVVYFKASDGWSTPISLSAPVSDQSSFGWSVDLKGNNAVIGVPVQGRAYVYEINNSTFSLASQYPSPNISYPNDESFGVCVAMDIEGSGLSAIAGNPGNNSNINMTTVIDYGGFVAFSKATSWPNQGSGRLFTGRGARYQTDYIYAAADLDMAPNKRAFAIPGLEEVIVESFVSGSWLERIKLQKIGAPNALSFGMRVDFSPSGKFLAVTEGTLDITNMDLFHFQYPGFDGFLVHIYEDTVGDGTGWIFRKTLMSTSSSFGYDVAMGDDDLFVIESSTQKTHHYIRSGINWTLSSSITSTNASAVDFDGKYLVIGESFAPGTVRVLQIH